MGKTKEENKEERVEKIEELDRISRLYTRGGGERKRMRVNEAWR